MKKAIVFGVLCLFIVFLFSGCEELLMGDDGKAYLKVVINDDENYISNSYDYYIYMTIAEESGFPESWSTDTYYRANDGNYAIGYSICLKQYQYSSYYSAWRYFYYINSYDTAYSYTSYSSSGYSAYYVLSSYFSEGGSLSVKNLEIEIEEGELLVDGDDTYYTLTITWDPNDITMSSNEVAMQKTVTIDGDSTILEFTDGYRTFTITVPEGASNSSPNPEAMSVSGEVE